MINQPTSPPSPWLVAARLALYRPVLFGLSFGQLATWDSLLLVTGWLLQQVFDALTGDRPAGLDVFSIIALLAAAEAARLLVMWTGVVRTKTSQQLRGLLRLNLLRAQLHSGGGEAGPPATSPGDAVSRIRDDVDDFQAFLETIMNVAAHVILTVGSLTIMLLAEPLIALAVALPLLAVIGVTRLVRRRIGVDRAAFRQATSAVTALLGETFGSVLAVKSAHAGDGIVRRLATLNERRRRTGLRDQVLTSALGGFNRITVDLAIGVVLLLAVHALRNGSFTVGELALFVAYLGHLVWLPYYAGQLLTRHRQARVAVERMTTLLPAHSAPALVRHRPLHPVDEPAGPGPVAAAPPLRRLAVTGLTAVHPSGRGVHDVELIIDRGSFTAITGTVGAGKTTLVRALLGLLPSRAGTVSWNGAVIDDPAAFFTPPRSGYVPQVPLLFSETLRNNLLLGRDDAELDRAVRTAALDRDVATLPAGLDTVIGARGVRLSGGQAQRAAIARALTARPQLLILDDVSSALDVRTERELWDRLSGTGLTLLAITNRPVTLARADQVVHLDHGRIDRVRAREPLLAPGRVTLVS
ncbi:ATP-binding cassette domain-containing protein [Microlunatus speluncae]|uniref:ATP-binding cassette domain-containing protein n=1 Tax=Microlunatus speluncae TaxID=2594267 RepID=UPI00126671E2|nr:ABC transporter ATP-binding protein [Microlunatus speluncae]